MKIGLIIYGSLDTLSGGYLYDRKLVEYLRSQGDTVEIISLSWRNYAAHLGDNLYFRNPAGFDILIQDELNHPSLIGANAGKHPCPIVSLVHHLRCSELRPDWQNNFYRSIERRYLRSVDGFFFNSNTTRDVVRSLVGNDIPGVVAWPPTDRFGSALPPDLVRSRVEEAASLKLLFIGNVIPRKGLHTLLEALRLVPPNSFELDIVGSLTSDPVNAKKMQQMASSINNSTPVKFYGSLNDEQLAKMLTQSHILVVPSSYEGFGIVYLEGMGFGLPAIGTLAGAASEIIDDGQTGYLIAPEDAATLATCLNKLFTNRILLTQLSLNALKRYQQQPTWEETAQGIRNFLLESVKQR
jgi:glycosyltransferase involved in cell wall biosynthesis